MKPTHTSESLPLVVDFLPPDRLPSSGQLGFTIAPGRNDEDSKAIWQRDLQADLTRLKEHYSVDRLVCLLGADERAGLNIPTLLDDAAALGIAPKTSPLLTMNCPPLLDAFNSPGRLHFGATAAGETVVVHCRVVVGATVRWWQPAW
jgi:hypothetical protein